MQSQISNYIRLLLILTLLIFSLFVSSNSNHGITGTYNVPNARFQIEGTLSMSFYRGFPDQKINITASPFNWLEATLFYTNIENIDYAGSLFRQSYKDKGFNIKYKIFNETDIFPSIALGLNDFAGTGFFSSEYIVASKRFGDIDLSAGMGWGEFSGGYGEIPNPLATIDQSFENRDQPFGTGGFPRYKNFFSGKNSAFFASLEYKFSKNTIFFFEIDPTRRDSKIDYKKSEQKYNFGLRRKFKNLNLNIGFERESVNFNLSFRDNINKSEKQKFKSLDIHENKYLGLQRQLEANQIGLVSIREEQNEFFLQIKHNSYEDPKFATEIAIVTLNKFFPSSRKKAIHINHDQLDMSMMSQKIPSYRSYNLDSIDYEQEKVPLYQDFVVKDYFPIINNYTYLAPRFFVASRERFIFSGLFLENDTEIVWKENLVTSINLKQSLVDEFDGLFIKPPTTYPNQVRSDIKDYLNNIGDGPIIGRLQTDFFKNFGNNYYLLSLGINEEMFSSFGGEYLYSRPGSRFTFGFEAYRAYKRDDRMLFNSNGYVANQLRAKSYLFINNRRIILESSYGTYLAGDRGFTFNLDRRFKNGAKVGIFFSVTDVTTEQYGEGSFDKGIRFRIPVRSFFSGESSLQNYIWRPLTKDPAALLSRKNNLWEFLEKFRL